MIERLSGSEAALDVTATGASTASLAGSVAGVAVPVSGTETKPTAIQLTRVGSVPGARVRCDRDRILQVFGNLIGNALKFCRAGDFISVTVEKLNDEEVRFSVQDTGPGIPVDVLPHLFEPCWSGPEHKSMGSGLGLYIVRGIVDSHGGRVWAESVEGSGARFYFTLPLA